MGDPGLGRTKLDGVARRTRNRGVHEDSVVGRLRGWEEEHATWVAVECGSHAIESLLANKARVEVGEGEGELDLRVRGSKTGCTRHMLGREYARA